MWERYVSVVPCSWRQQTNPTIITAEQGTETSGEGSGQEEKHKPLFHRLAVACLLDSFCLSCCKGLSRICEKRANQKIPTPLTSNILPLLPHPCSPVIPSLSLFCFVLFCFGGSGLHCHCRSTSQTSSASMPTNRILRCLPWGGNGIVRADSSGGCVIGRDAQESSEPVSVVHSSREALTACYGLKTLPYITRFMKTTENITSVVAYIDLSTESSGQCKQRRPDHQYTDPLGTNRCRTGRISIRREGGIFSESLQVISNPKADRRAGTCRGTQNQRNSAGTSVPFPLHWLRKLQLDHSLTQPCVSVFSFCLSSFR